MRGEPLGLNQRGFELLSHFQMSAIDFGHFRLRPAFFFEFGQFDFGQFRLRPISTANFWMLNFLDGKVWSPQGWSPQRWSPQGWSPEGWGSQNFALFFRFSRHNFPPGLAHDSPRTPNVHISGHLRFKHHQNSTKGPPERKKKARSVCVGGIQVLRAFGVRKVCQVYEEKRRVLVVSIQEEQ